MDDIEIALRAHEYDRARRLIEQLPRDQRTQLLDMAAEIVDDGTAMRIIVGEGHCLTMTRKVLPALADTTPLHVIIHKGNIHALREIMKMDVSEQLTQQEQDECLVMAAKFGQELIVKELLQSLKPSNTAVEQAMCETINYRHAECADLIFMKFKDAVAHLFAGFLEQILRLKAKRDEMAQFACRAISASPAALTSRTADKMRTPLHISCMSKASEATMVTRALLDNGASLSAQDYRQKTPLDIAYSSNNVECFKMLLAVPDAPIFWKPTSRCKTTIYSRVIHGNDMQLVDMMLTGNKQLREHAGLLTASMNMKTKLLFSHLIATYPNIVNARNTLGRNGLMCAIYQKVDKWYFDMMISHGVYSLDDADNYGHNIAHYAASAASTYHVDFVRKTAPHLFYARNVCNLLPVDCVFHENKSLIRRILSISKSMVREARRDTVVNALMGARREFVEYARSRSSLAEALLDVDYQQKLLPDGEQQVRAVRRTY